MLICLILPIVHTFFATIVLFFSELLPNSSLYHHNSNSSTTLLTSHYESSVLYRHNYRSTKLWLGCSPEYSLDFVADWDLKLRLCMLIYTWYLWWIGDGVWEASLIIHIHIQSHLLSVVFILLCVHNLHFKLLPCISYI
mgnify:FL=1